MNVIDLISKKRDGNELSRGEIEYFINGYVSDSIKDYQASAMLMAIYLNGMTNEETFYLTDAMVHSGDIMDLSAIPGVKVDKHSTGGVGDKTTLIAVPIAAAAGVKIAKLSGRGLGHTGGTLDKLEAVPGLKTAIPFNRFAEICSTVGCCVASQTANLVPADKKLYALRDVTSTVGSVPLIASSVMSKKIASGADALVLDVKYGSGAFMKTPEEAEKLASLMLRISSFAGLKARAVISNMDIPLGDCIGNSLELREAFDILKNGKGGRLTELCLALSSQMIALSGSCPPDESAALAEHMLKSGDAYKKLLEMLRAQGGDTKAYENGCEPKASFSYTIPAPRGGYISRINTEAVGFASGRLGAGRQKKDDTIDPLAGIVMKKTLGDRVCPGDPVAVLYTDDESKLPDGISEFESAFEYSDTKPDLYPVIYKILV